MNKYYTCNGPDTFGLPYTMLNQGLMPHGVQIEATVNLNFFCDTKL